MVCTDIAKIILEYVREIKRYEQMEMLYQRYKAHFQYVFCVPVPIWGSTLAEPLFGRTRRLRSYNRRFGQAQNVALRLALKTRRLGYDWRFWFSRIISESDLQGWHGEFYMTGVIQWADPAFGFELSSLCQSVGLDHLRALGLF